MSIFGIAGSSRANIELRQFGFLCFRRNLDEQGRNLLSKLNDNPWLKPVCWRLVCSAQFDENLGRQIYVFIFGGFRENVSAQLPLGDVPGCINGLLGDVRATFRVGPARHLGCD